MYQRTKFKCTTCTTDHEHRRFSLVFPEVFGSDSPSLAGSREGHWNRSWSAKLIQGEHELSLQPIQYFVQNPRCSSPNVTYVQQITSNYKPNETRLLVCVFAFGYPLPTDPPFAQLPYDQLPRNLPNMYARPAYCILLMYAEHVPRVLSLLKGVQAASHDVGNSLSCHFWSVLKLNRPSTLKGRLQSHGLPPCCFV